MSKIIHGRVSGSINHFSIIQTCCGKYTQRYVSNPKYDLQTVNVRVEPDLVTCPECIKLITQIQRFYIVDTLWNEIDNVKM